MNPPAALYGAMNRERKPFTYTPGGLDLSEIKSERMAKRLMRNAMNQGVDTPVQTIKTLPSSSIPVAIPNYNCLPVQVFPTFTLPANPKSLLRTRSNPDGSSQSIYKPPSHYTESTSSSLNTNKPSLIPTVKNNNVNNQPVTLNNNNHTTNNVLNIPKIKNRGDDNILLSPLINDDAEYLSPLPVRETTANRITSEGINNDVTSRMQLDNKSPTMSTINDNNNSMVKPTLLNNNNNKYTNNYNLLEIDYENDNEKCILPKTNNFSTLLENDFEVYSSTNDQTKNYPILEPFNSTKSEIMNNNNILMIFNNNTNLNNNYNLTTTDDNIDENKPLLPEICYDAEYFSTITNNEPFFAGKANEKVNIIAAPSLERLQNENLDMFIKTTTNTDCNHNTSIAKSLENKQEQKEVTTVTKVSKKENEVESQNGDTDAAVTVKLPSKKSAAKTETQVEVVKKVLPDGSVEEIKTTTTKTTIDGKTEIKTTTETTITPKEETIDEDEIEEVEVEEEEADENEVVTNEKDGNTKFDNQVTVTEETERVQKTNGCIITQEEKLETSTTKKVTVQSESQESEEEVEEEAEEEIDDGVEVENDLEPDVEEVVVINTREVEKSENDDEKSLTTPNNESKKEERESSENESDIEEETKHSQNSKNIDEEKHNDNEESKQEEEAIEEFEEEIEQEVESQDNEETVNESLITKQDKIPEKQDEIKEQEEEEEEEEEELIEAEGKDIESEKQLKSNIQQEVETANNEENKEERTAAEEKNIPIQQESTEKEIDKNVTETENQSIKYNSTLKDPLREPSVPLEKVEDIEIKPIGPAQEIIKKSHTEIITTKTAPSGALSTQTEYNRIENIVTVNRTTKTLDHAYEQAAEHTIPIIKTYFPPPEILSQPTGRPYQPIYPTEPEPERRHSLLLERLSMERQLPSTDIYQNNYSCNNQSYEETQYSFEPQSEVLTESNVKPSAVSKNQQWYQQAKKETSVPSQDWSQQKTPYLPEQQFQSQTQYQPQPQYQSQPQYQPQPQFHPQPQYQSQTQFQLQEQPQYIVPQQTLQSSYIENSVKNSYKAKTDDYKQNSYSSYTPKPSWVSSTQESKHSVLPQSTPYSSFNNQSRETYQNSTHQINSSCILPPWEQDTGYASENVSQNAYQPQPVLNTFTPAPSQSWKPNLPSTKFTKPTPTAYIPPAPNQSFVKPVSSDEPPVLPGRKTYYSEYERRYISVPESTYIPTETKYQAQPNPSPSYYYDQVETTETIEPQWRKELREFTEKTQTTQIKDASVRPPWEEDSKYVAPGIQSTPTWNQTLRPQSWRERSYEPEYAGAKEWPKTNTLGRGRPQSSYAKNGMDRIPEKPRGVSVDRYNPNSYQMPEHPPVQSQTLDHSIHPKPHYNPNVPGYHSRASAEPRELPVQSRSWGEARASPLQSRSFKYLQWITGTED